MPDGSAFKIKSKPDFTRLATPMTAAPLPSVVDLGRRYHALTVQSETIDKHVQKLDENAPDFRALATLSDRLGWEQDALLDLIMARPAETLADAAALLALVFDTLGPIADRMAPDDDYGKQSRQCWRATASALAVVARVSGVCLDDHGWSTLPDLVAKIVVPHDAGLAECSA